MTAEDDRIRQALSSEEPSCTAHSTLPQLRPTMQRARRRRRVATGAATLALLAGGSAGAVALVGAQNPPTLRTVNSDDAPQSVRPEPTTVPTTTPTTAPTTTQAPAVTTAPPLVVAAQDPTTSSSAPEAADTTPPDDPGRAPGAKTPVPTTAPSPPAPTPAAPPPPAAPAVFRTIASDCGDVLVSIENGAVRIVSITARPGYESQVSDGGPISIEIVLRGTDDKCELHAELKSGGLDIEVQNPSLDD